MGKNFNTGLITNAISQDASNNIAIGGAVDAAFKLKVFGASTFTSSVGVGVSPKTILQINAGSGAYPTLGTNVINSFFVGRNDGLIGMYLGYAADGNGWIQQMRNDSATAGNLILQPSGGNVGIGTSSPSATLHTEINSSTWVSKIINTNTITNNAGLLIKAGVNSGNEILLAQKANGTTVFLVDAGGNVLINTNASNGWPLEIEAAGGGEQIYLKRSAANAQIFMGGNTGATTTLFVRANGSNGVYMSANATSWTNNSDIRLKNINSNIENALEKLLTLNAVNYSWKSDITNKENLGLIAQEVEKAFPQLIDKNKVNEQEGDETEYLGVRYTELIPVLVKAIQELNLKIEELRKV